MIGTGVRYLMAGGFNTLATYLLYLGLLKVMGYRSAYLLAFLAGIGLSFTLLRRTVFARPGRRMSFWYVAASHGLQLGLGLLTVEAWMTWVGGPAWAAPLAAVMVCVPLLFVVHYWIFTPDAQR